VTHLALLLGAAPAAPGAPPSAAELRAAAHALDRLGYGARPGEVERVAGRGVAAWIDEQLHPERVAEPSLERRLAGLATVRLSTGELLAGYDVPRDARREMQRRRAELGDDPGEAELQQLRREMRRELPSLSSTFTGISEQRNASPATPTPLSVASAMVEATWVPWKLSSLAWELPSSA
jgi:hypothetical protein